MMNMLGEPGTTARTTAACAPGESGTPLLARRHSTDPELGDLTLYLVEVPQGWELRSWHGHGIIYSDLTDPLRLAQGWVEEGPGRMLITRSARG